MTIEDLRIIPDLQMISSIYMAKLMSADLPSDNQEKSIIEKIEANLVEISKLSLKILTNNKSYTKWASNWFSEECSALLSKHTFRIGGNEK